jgi:hypothetical protein
MERSDMHSGLPLLVAALLLPIFGTLVSACGEESRGNSDNAVSATASDRSRDRSMIRRTIKRAKHEGTDGSAAKTCRYITSDGQKRAIDAYAFRYMKQLKSCPEMVRFARKAEAPYLNDARRATIERIRLRGRHASVEMEGPRGEPLPGDKRGYGGIVGLELRKIGSRWQVDDTTFVPYGTGK